MDYGRYDVSKLESYDGKSIDLIRVSFFEWDLDNIKDFIVAVQDKGYLVSIQPMDTFSYTDEDIDAYLTFAEEEGYDHIVLAGHSLGANKVIYYLYRPKSSRFQAP